MIEELFGNWYIGILVFLGILSALYLVQKYRKAKIFAKGCLYAIFILFWYGLAIPLILNAISYAPVQQEYSILFYITLHLLAQSSPQSAMTFYWVVNSNPDMFQMFYAGLTSFTLDDFRSEIGLLLDAVLPIFFIIKGKLIRVK